MPLEKTEGFQLLIDIGVGEMKNHFFYFKGRLRICLLLFLSLLIMTLLLPDDSFCSVKNQETQPFKFSKNPDIQQVKPKKPVKIKLKRSAKGEYSWELSGDNVDDIIKADKRLRKLLEIE